MLGEKRCNSLISPVTKYEVREAVMSMNSFKAPGPNGFQPFFFKCYWNIVGGDLWKLVASSFRIGSMDPNLVETLVVLIPKDELADTFKKILPY